MRTISIRMILLCACFFLFFSGIHPLISSASILLPGETQTFTRADGLPSDTVLCITQDKQGDYWIGTGRGLSRFNGKSFINYNKSNGLTNNRVWTVLCTRNGDIWAGSEEDGLFRFDGKKWRQFTKSNSGLPTNSFHNGVLIEDRQGNIWGCGIPRSPLFIYEDGKFIDMGINHAKDICEDPNENLFVITWNGTKLFKGNQQDGYLWSSVNVQLRASQALFIDSQKTIWVATDSALLKSVDGGISFQRFNYDPLKIEFEKNCWEIFTDHQQMVWILYNNYIVRFNGEKFDYFNLQNELPNGGYYDIFEDRSGNYWLCCGGGLHRFRQFTKAPTYSYVLPKIEVKNLLRHYYGEQNNHPVFHQATVSDSIEASSISFAVNPLDTTQLLKYSVQLAPEMNSWTPFQQKSEFEFEELKAQTYTLRVRAKDKNENISDIIENKFTVIRPAKLPVTQIQVEEENRDKIFTKFVKISVSTRMNDSQFAYRIDDNGWSAFSDKKSFNFSGFQSGNHSVEILARNRYGIEAVPAVYVFTYFRIPELPLARIVSTIPGIIPTDSVSFQFELEEKNVVDIGGQPCDSIFYSYRLIPIESKWSIPTKLNAKTYRRLKNGSYLFQVITVNNQGGESVGVTEKFFTIDVIPFYYTKWFLALSSTILGLLLFSPVVFLFSRSFTKRKIYEDRFNPYVVGEAVHADDMFFGRENLIKDVLDSLNKNSICLLGERRIGKTTLLEHIEKRAQAPFFPFFCNLESVKAALFFHRIMQALISKIELIWLKPKFSLHFTEKKMQHYDEIDFEDDIETVVNFLKINHHPESVIVMCLDEIDATKKFNSNIHQSLRSVFQTHRGKIRMVAAGIGMIKSDWDLDTSPWYNFFEYREVLPFSNDKAERLITKPVKGFYAYRRNAIEFIVQKTEGKPHVIQMICKRAITKILDEKRRTVKFQDIKCIYDDMIHNDFNREYEVFWEEMSVSNRKLILRDLKGERRRAVKPTNSLFTKSGYNYNNKVITWKNGELEYIPIFMDWLKNQHFDRELS